MFELIIEALKFDPVTRLVFGQFMTFLALLFIVYLLVWSPFAKK